MSRYVLVCAFPISSCGQQPKCWNQLLLISPQVNYPVPPFSALTYRPSYLLILSRETWGSGTGLPRTEDQLHQWTLWSRPLQTYLLTMKWRSQYTTLLWGLKITYVKCLVQCLNIKLFNKMGTLWLPMLEFSGTNLSHLFSHNPHEACWQQSNITFIFLKYRFYQ